MKSNNVVVQWDKLNQWAARELDGAVLRDSGDSSVVWLSGRKIESVFKHSENLVQIEYAYGSMSVFVPEHFVTDIDKLAQKVVRDELGVNQTSLVEELLKRDVFAMDDIENMYSPRDEDDLIGDNPEAWEAWESLEDDRIQWANFTEYLEREHDKDVTDYESGEIFEWWTVSRMLERDLREAGQPILDNDYGTWWGRCTTGQQVYLDEVMQDIARRVARA